MVQETFSLFLYYFLLKKLSDSSKDHRSQVMNEITTDESNDVVFMEEPGPKSFKNLFSHEHKTNDAKKATVSKEIISSTTTKNTADQEKDKQHKDDKSKSKNDGNGATKRTDWDMFAEQDIDSNFDVI